VSAPAKHHTEWSSEDKEFLRVQFEGGAAINDLAFALERTKSSILGRLAQMGLVQWDNEVKQYFKIVWLGK